jgi:hypothetical protein
VRKKKETSKEASFCYFCPMSIKNGFIAGIIIFLLFILFKGSIKNDTAQMVFAVAFVLAEITVITLVVRNRR